ncbi:uncharacterized protein UTRI_03316_B [Ustilago trichophora]|uniref:Uncharacterized protein n=1 Tax=Ustilago trichophora TaxID=86804 RepID=A0A5C3E5A9_9BASI|nr:uncharacterized protein UTRI_03316_B [Ustilago trichophora]
MKINRIFPVFILATYAFGVRPQFPAAIEQGHQALKWLYEEAENGRFMYDLRRDYPNIQSSWPNFLASHGKAIVDQHYATLPRTRENALSRQLLLDRITGQDKTNIEFANFGPAPIDATKKLVESFAERRRAAAELSLARPGT